MASEAASLEYLLVPSSCETALASLTEPVRGWFQQTFGQPTLAQRFAWPVIAEGKHLLLSAPTGSGKTVAAFLPILDRLLGEPFSCGIRLLYVAPLKALVQDARKTLRKHVRTSQPFLPDTACSIRIAQRTGDTSARARRQLRLQPPDILLTTPESLAVLLSQPAFCELFASLRWLIIDEVHALAPNKRGADLALSLERLEALGAGPQRIGLSATCVPLSEAAGFLVGGDRPCSIAQIEDDGSFQLAIEPLGETGFFVQQLLDRLEPELTTNATTLIFTNTRGLAERLVWAMRRRWPALGDQIAIHHSSLAARKRQRVEHRMKKGRLRVVVSSTSLELGVDMAGVSGVVLVHPPGGVVKLMQRLGRSGHGPRRSRRGVLLTAVPAELLEAAVTAASGHSVQYEPLRIPCRPLDVLCQHLVAMAAQRPWTREEAWALVRLAYPYRELARRDFDDCLHYLSGMPRDGETWLPARLRWQGETFSILDDRAARILRRNLGTILTEETRPVLLLPDVDADPISLGFVDEPFADRLQPGDRFLLDGRCLEYRRLEGRELIVQEVPGRPAVPRWAGDGWPLSPDLARRIYLLRIQAAEALREGHEALNRLLGQEYGLHHSAAEVLASYFQLQEMISEIPDTSTFLIERVAADFGSAWYFHTPLNRPGNDALARVVVHRLARDQGQAVSSVVADLGFALFFRTEKNWSVEQLLSFFSLSGFAEDLQSALADSLSLRERFRKIALTGLMLLKNPLGGRRRVGGRDWAERRLFERVSLADPDFVLLRQARREVQAELVHAASATEFLERLPALTLRCRFLQQASPFAESWTQLAPGPVETSDGPAEALQRLHQALVG